MKRLKCLQMVKSWAKTQNAVGVQRSGSICGGKDNTTFWVRTFLQTEEGSQPKYYPSIFVHSCCLGYELPPALYLLMNKNIFSSLDIVRLHLEYCTVIVSLLKGRVRCSLERIYWIVILNGLVVLWGRIKQSVPAGV